MKRRLFVLIVVLVAVQFQNASAHVFVPDSSGQAGLIMHIAPADDPVVNEEATVYFDLQGTQATYEFTFFVTAPDGRRWQVPVTSTGSAAGSAIVVFPARGQYRLELEAADTEQDSEPLHFTQYQLVSRGGSGTALEARRHTWAELMLVGAGTGLLLTLAVVFVRRHAIAAFSK